MYYNYVLKSKKDSKRYIGFADDLKKRLEDHNKGLNKSTKDRRPFELIYYEACQDKKDALIREKYLKTMWGNNYLNKRLRNSIKKMSFA